MSAGDRKRLNSLTGSRGRLARRAVVVGIALCLTRAGAAAADTGGTPDAGAAPPGAPNAAAPTVPAKAGNPPAAQPDQAVPGGPGTPPPSLLPSPAAEAATGISTGGDSGPSSNAEEGTTPQGEGGAGLFEQSASAGAGAAKTDSGMAAASAAPPFTLTGYMRGDVFVGKVPDYRAGVMKAGYGELSLALRTAKGRHGDGFAEVRVRHGVQGGPQQTFVDLREAYVNAYVGPVDLRLGQQIIVWGRADALNPTNNLTPFNLRIRSPIEDDRRVGNVGARMFARLAPLRFEGVWLPSYLPSELPTIGLPELVTYGEPRFPRPELKNGIKAARVHLELAKFEASVSYLHGYAPLPGLTLSRLTFDPDNPSVLVSRTAYDHQVVGIDFSTALGDVLAIRGEAAYRRPSDYQNRIHAPRPDVQYVLGVDRAFGSVSVIAQYMGRYVFDWRKETGPPMGLDPSVLGSILRMTPADAAGFWQQAATDAIGLQLAKVNQILFSQTARIQHLATVRLEWLTAHDTLSIAALAMVNFTTREWLASPKIGYRISDAMIAYLGAEIFSGPTDTLFGLIDEELSAGYTELRFTF